GDKEFLLVMGSLSDLSRGADQRRISVMGRGCVDRAGGRRGWVVDRFSIKPSPFASWHSVIPARTAGP
ncbi:hypothetical protein, partial [Achromobacter sp. 2789STDY5608615]|uniref:hypothetical protein n=1 Tax=Achromobacter sp. 2789STDY5608615 TaxID=1806492 RepID=UPI001E64D8E6